MTVTRLIVVIILFISCLTLELTRLVIKPFPPMQFPNVEDQFKYGSIGAETNGYPFLIWRELPSIFHDRIPEGWKHFGFIEEPNRDLPIGISVRRVGTPRVGFNCATCHTSVARYNEQDEILLGAPASQLDIQSYLRFLADTSIDPSLTPEAVFSSAERSGHQISWYDKVILRYFVFPRLASQGSKIGDQLFWMARRPAHGPGRTDAANFWRSHWGLHPEDDTLIGTVDFPAVWNQRDRVSGSFHWDGNNTSLDERNYSAALAGGSTEWLLPRRAIGKISNWLLDLKSPKFPGPINESLAAQGAAIYKRERCSECHDKAEGMVGKVTSLQQIGSDPSRLEIFTPALVEYFNRIGEGYSWRFSHYRKTDGYVNLPLDGIWARAPYLHNGSVPTLRALLSPVAERPTSFFRGCTEFDEQSIGFNCSQGFLFNTQLLGNGNSGHLFGTTLTGSEKSALIEYLKSF